MSTLDATTVKATLMVARNAHGLPDLVEILDALGLPIDLHRVPGALDALRSAAATGRCGWPHCREDAAGYAEPAGGRPMGVCRDHMPCVERRGLTIHHLGGGSR